MILLLRFPLFILFSIFFVLSNAQEIRDSELNIKIEEGARFLAEGKYDSAQSNFLFALKYKKKVPSDLVYYFGRNSYHLNKHKQSINWLNKYIQLKGTKGKYYEPAIKFLQLAENQYLEELKKEEKVVKKEFQNTDYDCEGLSKMLCPVCHGSGVLVSDGLFGKTYKTCPYSQGEGYLSCEEYNLFMRGKLKPKN